MGEFTSWHIPQNCLKESSSPPSLPTSGRPHHFIIDCSRHHHVEPLAHRTTLFQKRNTLCKQRRECCTNFAHIEARHICDSQPQTIDLKLFGSVLAMSIVKMPASQTRNSSSLNAHWPNQSSSSVNSFHSAITNMELGQLSPTNPQPPSSNPHSAPKQKMSSKNPTPLVDPEPMSSPELGAIKMGRQDSGFSDGVPSQESSRPTSSSSTRHSKSKRSSTGSRPSTRRAPRSTHPNTQHRSSISSHRPQVRTRHTMPEGQVTQHQFFQFPTLQDATQNPEPEALPPPPPATVHYWTSDSTRRLEYAAIDAANRGVRGFFIKLVPDCILSEAARRTRFHDDDDSDAGSVRRYRLVLPEEKASSDAGEEGRCRTSERQRPGAFRRWTSLGFGRGKN